MADQPLPVTAASPARRRLLLGLASAPLAMSLPIRRPARPVVLGIGLAGRVDVTATSIRFFDSAGRLRAVVGAFSSSP